jgi:flagellar protein FliS
MDAGGRPAESLSEFYAAIFAQILQASQAASKPRFEHAIDCVRNVRNAWREVAKTPAANPSSTRVLAMPVRKQPEIGPDSSTNAAAGSSWTA